MSIVHLDKENFRDLIGSKRVVVDFFATWCGPCKMLGPIFEKVASSNDGVVFIKVDVDKHEDIAREYGVMSIPTVVFFKDGQEIKRNVGFMSEDALQDIINDL